MKKVASNIIIILIVALVILTIGFYIGAKQTIKEYTNLIDSDSSTVSIDLPLPVEESTPEIVFRDTGSHTIKIRYRDTIIFVPVPVPVDSAAIVADYLTLRNYHIDTTINEVYAQIDWSIYANKTANISFQFTNLRTCKDKRLQLKAGFYTGFNDISPAILIDYKKFTYQVSYDLIGEEKGFRLGVFYDF